MTSPQCFVWDIDPVMVHLYGSISIRYYAMFFVAVILLGCFLWLWQITRQGYSKKVGEAFLIPITLSVMIGSWLGHRLFYEWNQLLADPLAIFSPARGVAGLS